jgi:hypothetical protein
MNFTTEAKLLVGVLIAVALSLIVGWMLYPGWGIGWILLVIVVVFLVLLFSGLLRFFLECFFEKRSKKYEAIIIGNSESTGSYGIKYFSPVVSFVRNGKKHELCLSQYRSRFDYPKDTRLVVSIYKEKFYFSINLNPLIKNV